MALQKEKKEKERESYLKNSKGSEIQAQKKWGRHQRLRSSKKDAKMARCEKVEKKAKSF